RTVGASSNSVNIVDISIKDCRTSRYTVPKKFNGIDSWNNNPFTRTRSPTVKDLAKLLIPVASRTSCCWIGYTGSNLICNCYHCSS
uniref:Glycoprotein NB n=1 Tax=Schistosoma curassoni TaxID=6186 RepID=A0A183JFY3_9TREM